MNNNLKGIVIDAGHGGTDSGALGNNQKEKDYSLKISKYMYDRLKELGIPVTLTRDTDTTLTPTERVNKILSAYGNDPNVIVISNHLNPGGGSGAEVIYALRNSPTLANSILSNIGETGQTKRRTYQRRLPSNPSKDYYFIHRNTGITEPLIIEYGFIDDNNNINFLNNNYKALAESVIKAILEYKNIPYTPPKEEIETTDTYIVKRGDTLYSIANKYDITVDKLKELNNLTSNTLSIGQILKVSEETPNTYTVKKGDTLYSIAKRFKTTEENLMDLNNLTNTNLSVGQVLNLIPTTATNYIVKPGDTLYSIAREYNITPDDIKSENNLTSNILLVGQELKLPTIKIPTTYIVAKGDTLYSIANKFNTTIQTLINLNNLANNNLSIGQELLLP